MKRCVALNSLATYSESEEAQANRPKRRLRSATPSPAVTESYQSIDHSASDGWEHDWDTDSSTELDVSAPMGYKVTDSPNEDENGTYACPHTGCDGYTLPDAQACFTHEAEWHAGPYVCGLCSTRFAALPALRRHAKMNQTEPCRRADNPGTPVSVLEIDGPGDETGSLGNETRPGFSLSAPV